MSKSVRTRPLSQFFSEGTEIRSEEKTVDRHGVAARFLRLAFRINMEQLKLVEQDAPPMPEPLTAEDLAEAQRQDAAIRGDFEAAERRSNERAAEWERQAEAAQAVKEAGESMQDVNKVHNAGAENLGVSDLAAEVYAAETADEKKLANSCITGIESRSPMPLLESANPY
jgi:hypothetical protein